MATKKKKRSYSRKSYRWMWYLIFALIVLIAVLIGALSKKVAGKQADSLTMPYQLESGLVIDTYFQYTGANPDCQNAEATDVASIQVINQTGKYVKEAVINMTLDDSQTYTFKIQDLPKDEQVYAFDINNASCLGTAVATALTEEVDYADERTIKEGVFEISSDATTALITNISDKDIEAGQLFYHDQMEGILFGGISYQKEMSAINAGGSTSVDTAECYMGGPKIVGYTK